MVFVDIDLNGGDGMNCAKALTELDPKLKVIFATAHSEYMANAFEIYAFDYLVKPFNMDRMVRTLDRIRNTFAESGQTALPESRGAENPAPPDKISRSERYKCKLLIKGKEQTYLVDAEETLFVERTEGSTNIVTAGEQYRTSLSLSDMEAKLDADRFLRCHKSYIGNLSKITRIEPYGRWTYVVRFRNCELSALMTAQNYEKVRELFS